MTGTFQQARKAFTLSTLVIMAIYAMFYVAETNPRFLTSRRKRSISTTADVVNITAADGESDTSAKSIRSGGAGAVTNWAPMCQKQGIGLARPFGSVLLDNMTNSSNSTGEASNLPYWCTQDTYDKSCRSRQHMLCHPKGLLFVKTPKTGSTTISKVVKRIVQNVAQRSLPKESNDNNKHGAVCQHREDHVNGAGLWYGNRVHDQSFLMTSLRDPAQRAMSRFFWSYVTRHKNKTQIRLDDDFILDYLNSSTSVASGCTSKGQGGYQLNYMSMEPIDEWSAWSPSNPNRVRHPQAVADLVNRTMQEYDFIFLNERMEESLVILQFLLGLQTGDIVSLSYNVGGSYRYEHGKCKQLIKSVTSPGMQDYFKSDEWYAKNYGDYLLFAAVNRSIDLTIEERIGRERFDTALEEFRSLEAKVNDICSTRVPFPCSSNGTVLFHADHPIPHEKITHCINEVVSEEKATSKMLMDDNWLR